MKWTVLIHFSHSLSTASEHLSCAGQRVKKELKNPIRSSVFFPNMTQKASTLTTEPRAKPYSSMLGAYRTD